MSISHDFAKAAILSLLPVIVDESVVVPVKLDSDCHIYKIGDLSFAIPVIDGDLTSIEYDGQFNWLTADSNKLVTMLTLLAVDMKSLAKAIISFGANCTIGMHSKISYSCDKTIKFPFAEFAYVNKNLVLIRIFNRATDVEYAKNVIKFATAIMNSDDFKIDSYVKDLI